MNKEQWTPRQQLDKSISDIYDQVLEMGNQVEKSLKDAIQAVIYNDIKLAKNVVKHDKIIDALQDSIEYNCIRLIAREQPVASDLRVIITVVKIVSDLERIGDHARFLALSLKRLARSYVETFLPDIEEMTKLGISMLHDSLNAFARNDISLAESIINRDIELDSRHLALDERIISKMKKELHKLKHGSRFLLLSRFLERLGDHVLVICDWIIYAQTGKHRA